MKHTPSKYVHDTKMGEKAPGQAGEMIEQNIMKFNTRKQEVWICEGISCNSASCKDAALQESG